MGKYEVVWGSGDAGENGVYEGSRQVVSVWELHRRGLTAFQVAGWSDGKIAHFVREHLHEVSNG